VVDVSANNTAASTISFTAVSAPPLLLHRTQPPILLRFFNAWFKFANVSQWSRDLRRERAHALLKSAWASWSSACRRLRPRSPDSEAAAGVPSSRPLPPQVALPNPSAARPKAKRGKSREVSLSMPSLSEPHRLHSRRLVSADSSARLMLFFGAAPPAPSFAHFARTHLTIKECSSRLCLLP
jgi:hypothetical protein